MLVLFGLEEDLLDQRSSQRFAAVERIRERRALRAREAASPQASPVEEVLAEALSPSSLPVEAPALQATPEKEEEREAALLPHEPDHQEQPVASKPSMPSLPSAAEKWPSQVALAAEPALVEEPATSPPEVEVEEPREPDASLLPHQPDLGPPEKPSMPFLCPGSDHLHKWPSASLRAEAAPPEPEIARPGSVEPTSEVWDAARLPHVPDVELEPFIKPQMPAVPPESGKWPCSPVAAEESEAVAATPETQVEELRDASALPHEPDLPSHFERPVMPAVPGASLRPQKWPGAMLADDWGPSLERTAAPASAAEAHALEEEELPEPGSLPRHPEPRYLERPDMPVMPVGRPDRWPAAQRPKPQPKRR